MLKMHDSVNLILDFSKGDHFSIFQKYSNYCEKIQTEKILDTNMEMRPIEEITIEADEEINLSLQTSDSEPEIISKPIVNPNSSSKLSITTDFKFQLLKQFSLKEQRKLALVKLKNEIDSEVIIFYVSSLYRTKFS